MPTPILEVIVQSVGDAREATRGGADRLEVVRSIDQGGLTPPLDLVRAIAEETGLPLRIMVRENGGFTTEAGEVPRMRMAIDRCLALAVDGIVLGFARDGRLAMDDVIGVLGDAAARVTFHRAFDRLTDPLAAIDDLGGIPQVDRILTGGGDGSRAARAERLAGYVARAGRRLTIIAGGGIDDAMLAALVDGNVATEVHVGRAARANSDPNGPVSAERVRRLRTRLTRD